MATNPKVPQDEKNLRDDHAHVVLTRKRSNPWPLILAIIAAIILIALIAWVILSRPVRPAKASATTAAPQTQSFLVEHFEIKPAWLRYSRIPGRHDTGSSESETTVHPP